jgi:hypothetical protein
MSSALAWSMLPIEVLPEELVIALGKPVPAEEDPLKSTIAHRASDLGCRV